MSGGDDRAAAADRDGSVGSTSLAQAYKSLSRERKSQVDRKRSDAARSLATLNFIHSKKYLLIIDSQKQVHIDLGATRKREGHNGADSGDPALASSSAYIEGFFDSKKKIMFC